MSKTKIDMKKINKTLIKKIDEAFAHGIIQGHCDTGTLGEMCVMDVLNYALGLPPSDDGAKCVEESRRVYQIHLNDSSEWKSSKSRARGMRDLLISSIGTYGDETEAAWQNIVAEQTIRQMIPMLFREVAPKYPQHKKSILAAADRCEKEGTAVSAYEAAAVGDGHVAVAEYITRAVAKYAARAAAGVGTVYTTAHLIVEAVNRAAYRAADPEKYLRLACKIGVDANIELQTPGSGFL